ncbi:MAG: EamA family transporter [Patescibacteria group bacterium]|nr:EamA family transporter [Patescibacteria group bacterium]
MYIFILVVIVSSGLASITLRLLGRDEPRGELPAFLFQFISALFFLPFVREVPSLSSVWFFPFLASVFYGLGNIFMFKAFEKGEVSLLAPLGNLGPVLTLLFSVVLLGEGFSWAKVLGTLLVVFGLAFLKKGENFLRSLEALIRDRNCRFYFLFLIFFNIAGVFDKKATPYFATTTYSFVQFFLPSLMVLAYLIARGNFGNLVLFTKVRLPLAVLTSLVISIRYASFYTAITSAELSLVTPLFSLSTFVSLFLASWWLKEKVEQRWAAALFTVLGSALLLHKL